MLGKMQAGAWPRHKGSGRPPRAGRAEKDAQKPCGEKEGRPPTSPSGAAGFCHAGRQNSRPCSRSRGRKAPAGFGAARRTARGRLARARPRRPRSCAPLPRGPVFPAHQESPRSRPPWNTRKDTAHARHSSKAMTASVRRRLFNSCRRADTAAMHGVYSSTNTR